MNRGYFWVVLIAMPLGVGVSLVREQPITAITTAMLGVIFFVLHHRVRANERSRTSGATHEPS